MAAGETLLGPWVLAGRLGTLDMLLTPRHVAQTMGAQGSDAVMSVKEKQPPLRAAMALVWAPPPWGAVPASAATGEVAH